MKKMRHSLDLSPESNEALSALAKQRGISLSEVLRRALALYKAAEEAKTNGKKLCAVVGNKIEHEFIWF
jgi:predicted transcriptional regulator